MGVLPEGAVSQAPPGAGTRLRPGMPGLFAPVGLVAAVWVAWAWNDGAYFGTTFYPGAFALGGLLVVLVFTIPFRARLRGPALVALGALLALAGWTLLSGLWSSAPAAAVEDAQKALLYAACFGIGFWVCNMGGRRMTMALWPVAVAGAVVALGTLIVLATGSDLGSYFHDDVTLKFPLGYRNANAAFFLISIWPLLVLASDVVRHWAWRALMVGSVTLMIEVAVLAQSRGSLPAVALALVVYIAASRRGLRAAIYVALALLPVLPALPALLDVFQHGTLDGGLEPILRDAARVMALSTVGSVVLTGGFASLVEPRIGIGRSGVRRVSIIAGIASILVIAVGGAILVERQGGPIHFLDQRAQEFGAGGDPSFAAQGVRFGANVGSNRSDFWRVSLDQGVAHPILGGGAGSFQYSYLEKRHSPETPNDPHSVEMLMLSELGLPGLCLFVAFVVAAGMAGLRSRRLGPAATAVTAAAFGAGTQWLMQGSYDWFWHYPAVTAPAIYLLGAAAAPHLLDPSVRSSLGGRRLLGAALAIGVLSCVPIYLSQRLLERAYSNSRSDPAASVQDLDRASDLNPLDSQPLLVKGVVLDGMGDRSGAISAFRDAVDLQGDNYATHYFLARELGPVDRAAALQELDRAFALNPGGTELRRLRRSLAG